MDEKQKTIRLDILGDRYSFASQEDEEYLKELAGYVNLRMKDIEEIRGAGFMRPALRQVLLALNLADDYFKEKNKIFEYGADTDRINDLRDKFESRISEKENELSALKLEFDREKSENAYLRTENNILRRRLEQYESRESENAEKN